MRNKILCRDYFDGYYDCDVIHLMAGMILFLPHNFYFHCKKNIQMMSSSRDISCTCCKMFSGEKKDKKVGQGIFPALQCCIYNVVRKFTFAHCSFFSAAPAIWILHLDTAISRFVP